MLDLFIEMTDQVFWEGYAKQLSVENPEVYQSRLQRFLNYYTQCHTNKNTSEDCFMAILQKNYDRSVKQQLQRK